jgi:hypothetical protein
MNDTWWAYCPSARQIADCVVSHVQSPGFKSAYKYAFYLECYEQNRIRLETSRGARAVQTTRHPFVSTSIHQTARRARAPRLQHCSRVFRDAAARAEPEGEGAGGVAAAGRLRADRHRVGLRGDERHGWGPLRPRVEEAAVGVWVGIAGADPPPARRMKITHTVLAHRVHQQVIPSRVRLRFALVVGEYRRHRPSGVVESVWVRGEGDGLGARELRVRADRVYQLARTGVAQWQRQYKLLGQRGTGRRHRRRSPVGATASSRYTALPHREILQLRIHKPTRCRREPIRTRQVSAVE